MLEQWAWAVLLGNYRAGSVAAAAALAAGLIYLWNTNEDFRAAVISAWETIKKAGSVDSGSGLIPDQDMVGHLEGWRGYHSKYDRRFYRRTGRGILFWGMDFLLWISFCFRWMAVFGYSVRRVGPIPKSNLTMFLIAS